MKFFKKFLLITIAVFGSIYTAQASVYQVNTIKVEFKRFNSQKIRAYAVDVATKRGFTKLLNNIVPQEYDVKDVIESIDLKKTDVVEKLNINNEINVKGKYYAEIDILYNKEKIKQILQSRRIPFTQESMGTVLLLPILQDQNQEFSLFEDKNKFKDLLVKNLEGSLLITPLLAKGDLQEMTTYNPQNILDENNGANVLELATKYETNRAIIALLQQNTYEDSNINQVTIKYLGFDKMPEEKFIVLGKTLEEATKEVASKIKSLWQENNLLEFNKPKRFVAMIQTKKSLDELYATIDQLESLKTVSSVKIKQITTEYAFVQTDFYGTPQEFLAAAKSKKLGIYQSNNSQWVIERVLD
ncbi:MAG TPA: hypothetical protein DCL21_02825 [Alphaproteobacteria bacterium]|nr:hypothetical protein [Alphaproteobacteria bacterium]